MRALLESTTIKHCRQERPIQPVLVSAGDSVQTVLRKLHSAHLHALPINDDGTYRGWISYEDIVHDLLLLFGTSSSGPGESLPHAWTRSPDEVTKRGLNWIGTPCAQLSSTTPWGEVYDHGTLAQLAEEIVDRQLHRVAIMTEKNILHSIISATDLIAFINDHRDLWTSSIGSKSVLELNLGSRNVISCSLSQDIMQAFFLMDANQVSAVAVTDASNRLVANLSAADLRTLNLETNQFVPTTFRSLLLPVSSFLARVQAQPPVFTTLTGSLASVVTHMALFHLHRVWIVDDQQRPIGIITTFDILKLFL